MEVSPNSTYVVPPYRSSTFSRRFSLAPARTSEGLARFRLNILQDEPSISCGVVKPFGQRPPRLPKPTRKRPKPPTFGDEGTTSPTARTRPRQGLFLCPRSSQDRAEGPVARQAPQCEGECPGARDTVRLSTGRASRRRTCACPSQFFDRVRPEALQEVLRFGHPPPRATSDPSDEGSAAGRHRR